MSKRLTLVGIVLTTAVLILGCGITITHPPEPPAPPTEPPVEPPTEPPVEPPPPSDCRTTGCPEGQKCVPHHGTDEWTCEAEPTPPPPTDCDEASIPLDRVIVNSKPYGKGFDSTVKVKSAAWCAAHGMAAWGNECPTAPEGDKCRPVRDHFILAPHVCPRWVFTSCPYPAPACPGTFKVRIGDVRHPINESAGCPDTVEENEEVVEGYWAQPSGHGVIAACTWRDDASGNPLGCGRQQSVDR